MARYNGRKTMSSGQSRKMSAQMRSATVGTHVPNGASMQGGQGRQSRQGSRDLNAAPHHDSRTRSSSQTRRSTSRTARQAQRGEVRIVTPTTKTGESRRDYSRRMGSSGFSDDIRKAYRVKRIVTVLVILVVLALIGIGTWFVTYNLSVGGNLAFRDDKVAEALVDPIEGEPYYLLLAADLNELDGSTDGVDALMLVRVDEDAGSLTLLDIPASISLRFADGRNYLASAAVDNGGDSELLKGLMSYLDLDISHYIKTSPSGIEALVAYFGGITVTVSEAVDDPKAGNDFIKPGETTLAGSQVRTFLRASNFKDGIDTQMDNQCAFTVELLEEVLSLDDAQLTPFFDEMSMSLSTDYSVDELRALCKRFAGTQAADIKTGYLPGYTQTRSNVTTFTAYTDSQTAVLSLFEKGQEPRIVKEVVTGDVDRSSITVTVRNGAGTTGAATAIATTLTDAGYKVEETGNADSYVYTETLVIYQDAALEAAANDIVSLVGCGRALLDVGYYAFETDILVVIGADWE